MQKSSSWATAWPPISLGVLAQIAKSYGEVRFLDGNIEQWTLPRLIKDIKQFNPDLILFNTGFPSIKNDMFISQEIKNNLPNIKLVAFGVFFTLLEKKSFKQYPFLDFCIYGEPEDTFAELLTTLNNRANTFNKIQGLMYKKNGDIEVNSKRPLQQNMDKIPFPARDLFKNQLYKLPHNNKTYTLINVGRGCPYSCTYCVVAPYFGKKNRKHSIEYLINEIIECKEKYNIEEFLFWDEIFTLNKKFAFEMCRAIIENDLNIKWAVSTRVDLLTPTLLKKMKEAGCYLIGLGIESGSQTILDNAKKEQTLSDIRNCVKMIKEAGIKTMGHFIFGLPGETNQTAEESIKFMLELNLNFMQSYCAVPYPKTEFGKLASQNNWINTDQWSNYDFGGISIIDKDTMSSKNITNFREKAFKKFYYRPKFIKQILKELSLKQIFKISQFTKWINLVRK